MNLFNQFSYPIIATVVLVALFLLLRRYNKANWQGILGAELLALALFVGGWIALQPGAGDADSVGSVENTITNGRPTFVEFFSNYCTGCLLMRPAVDRLVEGIDDEFNILRVNIHSDVGRELRQRYTFSFTPEFLLLTPSGNVVWRDHIPPSEQDLALARMTDAAMN